jgi:hypothetical protein
VAGAVALAWVALLALARQRAGGLATWTQSAGAAALAGVGSVQAATAGWLEIAGLLAISGALTVLQAGPGGLQPAQGLHCVTYELLGAALPALWVIGSTRRARPPRAILLPISMMAGAVAGHAALQLVCPAHGLAHLAAFHTGGVLLAGVLGLAIARLIPTVRPARG